MDNTRQPPVAVWKKEDGSLHTLLEKIDLAMEVQALLNAARKVGLTFEREILVGLHYTWRISNDRMILLELAEGIPVEVADQKGLLALDEVGVVAIFIKEGDHAFAERSEENHDRAHCGIRAHAMVMMEREGQEIVLHLLCDGTMMPRDITYRFPAPDTIVA